MQLNIKNKEAYEMAKELSLLTGENLTQAVMRALEQRLAQEHARIRSNRKGIGKQLKALAREYQTLPKSDKRHAEEILYDANGLPQCQPLQ